MKVIVMLRTSGAGWPPQEATSITDISIASAEDSLRARETYM
jgi:hypothetical protein